MAVLGVLVAALSIARAVVYFTDSDDRPTTSRSVSFGPTGGPALDGGLPTDVVTAVPSIDPAVIPSGVPSDAPTEASLGPVRYEVTGTGTKASSIQYTNADLVVGGGVRLALPYAKTIDGGIGTYFHLDAVAQDGTSITCRILAHHGVVEATRTARGRHAVVTCEWNVPYTP